MNEHKDRETSLTNSSKSLLYEKSLYSRLFTWVLIDCYACETTSDSENLYNEHFQVPKGPL